MADFSLGPSQEDADAFMREAQQKPVINDDDETVAPDHRSEGPVVTILIGMAGSGKTTLFHRLHYDAQEKGRRCYFVNLDPAVLEVPIEPQIDIRDTIDYKGIMTEYKLGTERRHRHGFEFICDAICRRHDHSGKKKK